MSKTRLIFAAFCAVVVAAIGASSAFAGEITGNGKWIAGSETAPLNGNSPCAFSGQNDNQFGNAALPTRTASRGRRTGARRGRRVGLS